MSRLVSVNVSLPRDIEWRGKTVYTAIWKIPVAGRLTVRRLNIDGDGQGDLAGHGGEHRAVMVYQLDSYRYWERHLGRSDFSHAQFGENLTIEGLPDDDVCIGDRYRIGTALFEVTQPRVTCYRVGIRTNEPQMAALLVSHHRPGFYFRVLEEGEVGAGDEIRKISDGPEHVSVAELDALLYLPGHNRGELERALRIPALSPGWKGSLRALASEDSDSATMGNAGLTGSSAPPPAWQGFRPLRVARVDRESETVRSFWLESLNGSVLPTALPGQFVVVKVRQKDDLPPLLRNYSISSKPGLGAYRISVKREVAGTASSFLHENVAAGDSLEASAPRGNFILCPGEQPIVLLSAGIGVTPVLAMLYSLKSSEGNGAQREVWWIYGTRNGNEHPFAGESRKLLDTLSRSRSYVAYSRPVAEDRLGRDYDAARRLSIDLLRQLGVPHGADFYLCGPTQFLKDLTGGLTQWAVPANHVYTETFGAGESVRPGVKGTEDRPPHLPNGVPGTGPQIAFARSGLTVPWSARFGSLLEFAEACDVHVKWSCRTGVCHMCESGILGGEVDYEPAPLENPAEGNLLICCSRPRGDVQLDL